MPPTVRLRAITDGEYDTLRAPMLDEFAADLARSAHAPVDDEVRARAAQFFPETLTDALTEVGTSILRVLDKDGADVGLLWLGRSPSNPRTGFVYDVIIEGQHRGRGLGRAAMLEAEKVLAGEGCTRVALNVFGWNEPAAGLYRSLGYGVDSMQMSKPVADDIEDPH
ncbi:MAG: GNAT family N-acetyltransferase [Sporichthyaceae bacterium]